MVFGPSGKAPEASSTSPAPSAQSTGDPSQAKQTGSGIPEEKGKFRPISFAGFTLPCRIGDAKTAGFTDCEAGYSGYSCKRAEPAKLFGVTAQSASLRLDGRDYYSIQYLVPEGHSGDVRQIPADELTYGEVVLGFAIPEFDTDCADAHTEENGGVDRPVSCVTNTNTAAHLSKALADGGWILSHSKGGYYNYVHAGEVVEIAVHSNVATIRRVSDEIRQSVLAQDAERRTAKAAAEADAAQVLEQMKR
jgi:predicted RNA binding protein YcfA (HicA-like mRNA interferase family)